LSVKLHDLELKFQAKLSYQHLGKGKMKSNVVSQHNTSMTIHFCKFKFLPFLFCFATKKKTFLAFLDKMRFFFFGGGVVLVNKKKFCGDRHKMASL